MCSKCNEYPILAPKLNITNLGGYDAINTSYDVMLPGFPRVYIPSWIGVPRGFQKYRGTKFPRGRGSQGIPGPYSKGV